MVQLKTKLNALLGLSKNSDAPAWELALLLLLLVTIFGFAVRGPMQTFPNLSQNSRPERDLYGIESDRPLSDRPALVETGL
ncbi:MAG TPA: hypothetical protein VM432_07890 [Bdellovibrionales bacterium]|jgi:hypothetical protein|nr:hypothetical protein [Bdellovibrionales bacterium]